MEMAAVIILISLKGAWSSSVLAGAAIIGDPAIEVGVNIISPKSSNNERAYMVCQRKTWIK